MTFRCTRALSIRFDQMLNPVHPFFYLLAYVVVLYVRPQEYVPAFVGSPVVPALLGFLAIFWLVAQKKNFEAPQHRLLAGLALAMFVSVALTGWTGGAVDAVVRFAPTMMLFYLIATMVDTLKRFREICLVLTVVCCVLAFHGVKQAAAEDGVGWTGAKMIEERITYIGFLNDPNDLAMAFLMTVPLTLYLAAASRSFIVKNGLPRRRCADSVRCLLVQFARKLAGDRYHAVCVLGRPFRVGTQLVRCAHARPAIDVPRAQSTGRNLCRRGLGGGTR